MNEKRMKISYFNLLLLVFAIVILISLFINPHIREIYCRSLLPILNAIFLAYMLDPFVVYLEKKLNISRKKSVGIAVATVVFVVVLISTLVIHNVLGSIHDFVYTLHNFENTLKGNLVDELFTKFGIAKYKELDENTIILIKENFHKIVYKVNNIGTAKDMVIKKIFSFCRNIISSILAVYMLLDKRILLGRFKRILYAFNKKKRADYVVYIFNKGNEIFSNFIVGKVVDSAILGCLCFVLLVLINCPYAILISLIVGVTNVIPLVGPVIGGVAGVIIILIANPNMVLIVGLVIALLQQFDGMILGPKILGDKIGVGAFWIIVAITISGAVGGIVGMIFGVPLIVLIKNIVEEQVHRKLKKKKMMSLEAENLKE